MRVSKISIEIHFFSRRRKNFAGWLLREGELFQCQSSLGALLGAPSHKGGGGGGGGGGRTKDYSQTRLMETKLPDGTFKT